MSNDAWQEWVEWCDENNVDPYYPKEEDERDLDRKLDQEYARQEDRAEIWLNKI